GAPGMVTPRGRVSTMLASSMSPERILPSQPQNIIASAKTAVVRNRFIASLLEEKKEEADADGRRPQEQRHVVGGLHPGVEVWIRGPDRPGDVPRFRPDPGHPRAQEEDELLLGAELEAERHREVVRRNALQHHLRSVVAGEPAGVAGEEVPTFEVQRG